MSDQERHSVLFDRGLEHQKKVWGDKYKRPSIYEEIDPEIYRIVIECVHAEILCRPGLDLKTRELLTIAMLTALGRGPEVELHINGALNVGGTRQEIVETLFQTAIYAGFPAMREGMVTAKKVFDERGL